MTFPGADVLSTVSTARSLGSSSTPFCSASARAREMPDRKPSARQAPARRATSAALALLGQSSPQLCLRQVSLLHEHLAERSPCGPQPGGAIRLGSARGLKLDPVLLREHTGERERREGAGLDQDLANEPAAALL